MAFVLTSKPSAIRLIHLIQSPVSVLLHDCLESESTDVTTKENEKGIILAEKAQFLGV